MIKSLESAQSLLEKERVTLRTLKLEKGPRLPFTLKVRGKVASRKILSRYFMKIEPTLDIRMLMISKVEGSEQSGDEQLNWPSLPKFPTISKKGPEISSHLNRTKNKQRNVNQIDS